MGILRRSEFLRCVPLGLWAVACGQSSRGNEEASRAGGGAGSGDAPSGGSGGSGAVAGAAPNSPTGGQPAASGGGHGGSLATTNKGNAGGGGTSGAAAATACPADAGATATAQDFSVNTETGQMDGHLLSMSRGDIVRRILHYTTSGEADHGHEFSFTDAQLVALLAGESVVVETAGPPLNAAAGHTHTVHVHACKA